MFQGSSKATATATAAAAAAAAAVAAGVVIGKALSQEDALLRLRLRLAQLLRGRYTLSDVRVPESLLPRELRGAADAEGLVACDVAVKNGDIAEVAPPKSLRGIDCNGALLVACFSDSHTHLVKTHAHPRARNATGSINGALAQEVEDQPRWAACACCRPFALQGGSQHADGPQGLVCPKADDVKRRMGFALQTAYVHGSKAIRTHLDGTAAEDKKLVDTVYSAFRELRDEYATKGLIVQGVANLYLPLWSDESIAKPFADRAFKEGAILGAYCGNVADTTPEETLNHCASLFTHAIRLKLPVDCHVDETNDARCRGLSALAHALLDARAVGYKQPVVFGHCTALALQSPKVLHSICQALEQCKPCCVVVNPSTNLGLQDRRGSAPPHCSYIDPTEPRTPKWRGLAPVQELVSQNIDVAAASDNVRDWWHPYGDYDQLETWKNAVTLGHLDTAPHEGRWAALVSSAPARAMGLASEPFVAGAPADLVLFPRARRVSELFARPHGLGRVVLRKGRVQSVAVPSYRLLDDVVAQSTPQPPADAAYARGAAKSGLQT